MSLTKSALNARKVATSAIHCTRLVKLALSCASFFFIHVCQMRSSNCGFLSMSDTICLRLTNDGPLYLTIVIDVATIFT
jgi:hypothetical protein